MATLTETLVYEPGIYQIETTDPVVGGPSGASNKQAKELANRTAWLKQQVDSLATEISGLETRLDQPVILNNQAEGDITATGSAWQDCPNSLLIIDQPGKYMVSFLARLLAKPESISVLAGWHSGLVVNNNIVKIVIGANMDETGASNQDTSATHTFFHDLVAGDILKVSLNPGVHEEQTASLSAWSEISVYRVGA